MENQGKVVGTKSSLLCVTQTLNIPQHTSYNSQSVTENRDYSMKIVVFCRFFQKFRSGWRNFPNTRLYLSWKTRDFKATLGHHLPATVLARPKLADSNRISPSTTLAPLKNRLIKPKSFNFCATVSENKGYSMQFGFWESEDGLAGKSFARDMEKVGGSTDRSGGSRCRSITGSP